MRWATLVWRGGHFQRPGANPTYALASHDRCTSFPQASHLYCSQSTNLKTTITALNLTYKTLLWYSAAENSDSWDPNLELWAANDPSVAAARRFFWLEGSALWWALEQPEPENSSGNLRLGGRSCVTRQDTDTFRESLLMFEAFSLVTSFVSESSISTLSSYCISSGHMIII